MRAHQVLVSLVFGCAVVLASAAQTVFADDNSTRIGAAAYGDWRSDAPGVRRKITPADMPALGASRVSNRHVAHRPRPDGAMPKVPPRFHRQPVRLRPQPAARDPRRAQWRHFRRRERRRAGERAARRRRAPRKRRASRVFAAGLNRPYGIAFYPPGPNPAYVYVAEPNEVVRFPYRGGDVKASGAAETIVPSLPTGGGHWTRDIAFSADGKTMFVSVGSGSNVAEDDAGAPGRRHCRASRRRTPSAPPGAPEENRADVLAFDPDGRNKRVFATACAIARA